MMIKLNVEVISVLRYLLSNFFFFFKDDDNKYHKTLQF